MIFPVITRTATQLQSFALAVAPHGGQGTARRNAWAAMSSDAAQARSRREAEQAVSRAITRAVQPSRATS